MAVSSNIRDNIYLWMTTIGCFLLFLPFGQTFYWRNMYIYCKSYLSHYTGMSPTDQAPWILSLKVGTTSVTSIVSGFLIRRTGKRPLLICGIVLTSASHYLTYLAIKQSHFLVILIFGILYGLADGFVFCTTIQIMVEWAGSKDGTFIGITTSGACVGAIITNYMVTWYVNPEDKSPDRREGPVLYFSQEDILDKVPATFIILGTYCTLSVVIGFFLVRIKQTNEHQDVLRHADLYVTCDDDTFNKNGVESHNIHQVWQSPTPRRSTEQQTYHLSVSRLEQSPENKEPEESTDITPRQMISMASFYAVSVNFITSTVTYIAVNNYYKEFGQLWIPDDFFLTQLGMALPIATIFLSVLLGVLIDVFSAKNFLIIYNASLSLLGAFYCFTPQLGVWVFSICTVVYGTMACPLYSIYDGVAAKLYGKTHLAANQGIIYLSSIVVSLVLSPILESIIHHFGWSYLFLFPALVNCIGLVVVVLTTF